MQPPCIVPGQPINACARALYGAKVLGHVDLTQDWAGWKIRGRWLISPDGDRINALRLRGLLFCEQGRKRVSQTRVAGSTTTTVVPLHRRAPSAP